MSLERGPLSVVSTIEELPERKSSSSGLDIRNTAIGICHAYHEAPSIHKAGSNFTDKLRSLSQYSSLVDSGYRVCIGWKELTLKQIVNPVSSGIYIVEVFAFLGKMGTKGAFLWKMGTEGSCILM
jgi:hypothetical protein